MPVTTAFDIAGLKTAIESKDLEAQAALFADDAEMVMIDVRNPPASPAAARGREGISAALREGESEGLTHHVTALVASDDRAAYTLVCRYPDGKLVVGNTILELRDGSIARMHVVQAWDE